MGGAWTVFRFKGALARKSGVVFLRGEGVKTPMHTMIYIFVCMFIYTFGSYLGKA